MRATALPGRDIIARHTGAQLGSSAKTGAPPWHAMFVYLVLHYKTTLEKAKKLTFSSSCLAARGGDVIALFP